MKKNTQLFLGYMFLTSWFTFLPLTIAGYSLMSFWIRKSLASGVPMGSEAQLLGGIARAGLGLLGVFAIAVFPVIGAVMVSKAYAKK